MVNSRGEQVSRKETGKESTVTRSQKGQPTTKQHTFQLPQSGTWKPPPPRLDTRRGLELTEKSFQIFMVRNTDTMH